MEFLLIGLGLILVVGYIWYAGIIGKRNKAKEALSGIDVQLTMRSELIPNILTIAKKFMEHEKSLLATITELRTKADAPYDKNNPDAVRAHITAAEMLSTQMGQLKIAVEAYPTLKSDQTMVDAMRSYNEVEAQLAAARRFYNAAVTSLNNSVQIFPGNVIAGLAGVSEMPFYQGAEGAAAPVNAKDYLG
jgi:LemA protein